MRALNRVDWLRSPRAIAVVKELKVKIYFLRFCSGKHFFAIFFPIGNKCACIEYHENMNAT